MPFSTSTAPKRFTISRADRMAAEGASFMG